MSFGYRDKDWIEPDEPKATCRVCSYWKRCPCGCEWGMCNYYYDWTEETDRCCHGDDEEDYYEDKE